MIDLENVSKTYSAGAPAVNDINLHIEKGEFVFVVGNSGAGKSTLIKLLLKELEPTAGRIIINGKDLRKIKHRKIHLLRRDIGVVFQDFRLLMDRNVYDNVAFAQRVVEVTNRTIRRRVPAMLSMVGLLADEPTGNLDPKNSWEIMKLLDEINSRGTTVIVVTHNSEIVDAMQKRVVTIHKGVIVSDEKTGGYIYED